MDVQNTQIIFRAADVPLFFLSCWSPACLSIKNPNSRPSRTNPHVRVCPFDHMHPLHQATLKNKVKMISVEIAMVGLRLHWFHAKFGECNTISNSGTQQLIRTFIFGAAPRQLCTLGFRPRAKRRHQFWFQDISGTHGLRKNGMWRDDSNIEMV